MTRWFVFAALLAALPIAACSCEDDSIGMIDPVLRVTPDHLDFGVVELTQEAYRTVLLENLEAVEARVLSTEVEDDCTDQGGCFTVIDPPDIVAPYAKHEMSVRFRAKRLEVATGTITIATDDPKAPVTLVTMIGRGSDMRRPCIEVAPPSVDFGFVPAGGIAVSSFVVRSCGTNDLLIDRVWIDPEDAPFKVTTSTPAAGMAARLAPGAQASVGLRAALPTTVTGTVTGRVLIATNVLEQLNVPGELGVVQVPLQAVANLPPVAVCGDDLTVEPWSRATLNGEMSHDQDIPPDEPVTYRWRLSKTPDGSTTYLERANTAMPSFWVDITGQYEAELVVTDTLGLESEPCTVVIDALPTNAIRIELTWDHPDSDLDLHLIRGGGDFCDCSSDCHYRDCGRTPNWFPASPGSNPRLDIDDRSGFGPENINIDGNTAERIVMDGDYQIAVHYYSSNSGVSSWPTSVSNATIRVFIFGLLAAEVTHPMEADGDLWNAATIHWPDRTVTLDGTVMNAVMCGIF